MYDWKQDVEKIKENTRKYIDFNMSRLRWSGLLMLCAILLIVMTIMLALQVNMPRVILTIEVISMACLITYYVKAFTINKKIKEVLEDSMQCRERLEKASDESSVDNICKNIVETENSENKVELDPYDSSENIVTDKSKVKPNPEIEAFRKKQLARLKC